jgi:hypothetical protein
MARRAIERFPELVPLPLPRGRIRDEKFALLHKRSVFMDGRIALMVAPFRHGDAVPMGVEGRLIDYHGLEDARPEAYLVYDKKHDSERSAVGNIFAVVFSHNIAAIENALELYNKLERLGCKTLSLACMMPEDGRMKMNLIHPEDLTLFVRLSEDADRIEGLSATVSHLEARVFELEGSSAHLQQEYDVVRGSLDETTRQLNELTIENRLLSARHESQVTQLEQRHAEVLRQLKQEHAAKIQEQSAQGRSWYVTSENRRARIEELEGDLAQVEASRDTAKQQVAAYIKSSQELWGQIDKLKPQAQRVAGLESEISRLSAELVRDRSQLEAAQQASEKASKQHKDSYSKYSKEVSRRKAAEARIKELEVAVGRIPRLDAQVAERDAIIAAQLRELESLRAAPRQNGSAAARAPEERKQKERRPKRKKELHDTGEDDTDDVGQFGMPKAAAAKPHKKKCTSSAFNKKSLKAVIPPGSSIVLDYDNGPGARCLQAVLLELTGILMADKLAVPAQLARLANIHQRLREIITGYGETIKDDRVRSECAGYVQSLAFHVAITIQSNDREGKYFDLTQKEISQNPQEVSFAPLMHFDMINFAAVDRVYFRTSGGIKRLFERGDPLFFPFVVLNGLSKGKKTLEEIVTFINEQLLSSPFIRTPFDRFLYLHLIKTELPAYGGAEASFEASLGDFVKSAAKRLGWKDPSVAALASAQGLLGQAPGDAAAAAEGSAAPMAVDHLTA